MRLKRDTLLPLIALLALGIYILACTSFSPDDKRILYPAFDSEGAVGIAVYDRDSKRSELMFVPQSYEAVTNEVLRPALIRAQWLSDGKSIVALYAAESDENLSVAVVPTVLPGAFRTYAFQHYNAGPNVLIVPPCLSGSYLFLKSDSEMLARLDLRTGQIKTAPAPQLGNESVLYPAPDGRAPFVLSPESDDTLSMGRLNSKDFSVEPTMRVATTNKMMEGSFLAYDSSGERLALMVVSSENYECVLFEKGKLRFSRKIGPVNRKIVFGNGLLSPRADRVLASFWRETPATNRVAYGLMEIPLGAGEIREKILVADMAGSDEMQALYFQVGVSHDMKTAAIATTYLACTDEAFKQEDCALFLVDLTESDWKVTKVPVPMPKTRRNPVK